SIRSHAVKEVANFIYAYLHFPVLAVVGAWLWWKGRERFVFMRNEMFISMVIGVAFYYLLPAAPPRLMALHGYDLGFVDTIFGGDTAVSYAQPSLIRNDYAAIPSFHFGWIALASAAMWVNTKNRLLRGVAVALAVAMTWSIVASANHLFIDMVLGGLVIAVAWYLAAKLAAMRASRNAPPPATITALPLHEDRQAA
ncbi:MAG: phosphatase PAP2 family protein, partial [Dehalococcoidia bacterium]